MEAACGAVPFGETIVPERDALAEHREAFRLASLLRLHELKVACDLFAAALPPPTADRGGQTVEAFVSMLAAMDEFNRADREVRGALQAYGALLDAQGSC